MAYYSKKTKLTNLPIMSNGAGTLSKDSYVLTEVTKIVAHDGYSDVTFKHSLYGKSTKQRSVKAELRANGSVSKTVTVTTSFTSLLTLTETVKCYDSIDTNVSGTLTYSDSSVIGGYGITTDPDVISTVKIRLVTFGKVSSYPYSMKYGETGTVTMDKSSDYRFEYYDTSGIKRYTVSFSGTSVDVTIPITVFQETGGNLTTMKCFEEAQGIDIYEVDYSCSVSETACSIGISAVRSSTDADPSLVTLTLVGESAASSTSRTVTIYAKETSASDWTTIGTISPAASSFTETFTADLAIDYAWDIYATISDGYTSAESTKVRIYSRSYIMDVRTDGKGIAFGGTAANADEMYCGFDTFRANKISAGNITAENVTPSDITGIANLIYPVGAIYISFSSTNPGLLFGGTWVQMKGRFLIGAGGSADEQNSLSSEQLPDSQIGNSSWFPAGETAGEYTHTLTAEESGLPAHTHGMGKLFSNGTGSDSAYMMTTKRTLRTRTTESVTAKNATKSIRKLPPYVAVYMWRRTA
ncbi:phage baseplate protein [Eubacterium pyruvativorans]|uniref:phage baseplate protein n=1 Tax=Eubacterium pyruvativorans TaxID=155865 RepID=UPI001569BC09|nr:hypothetical protein [Eubacterium pyruvativorans]